MILTSFIIYISKCSFCIWTRSKILIKYRRFWEQLIIFLGQSNSKAWKMKTFIFFSIVISRFHYLFCFLPYPFVANQFLDEILTTFYVRDHGDDSIDIEKDLMAHAIKGEKCYRECKADDRQICYFNFTLKHYQIMGG